MMINDESTYTPEPVLTCNITFVVAPSSEDALVAWLSRLASAGAFPHGCQPQKLRIQKVVGIGGEAPSPDHGLSIALQADFLSGMDVDRWEEKMAPVLIDEFMGKFGPHAAYFKTLLETTTLYG